MPRTPLVALAASAALVLTAVPAADAAPVSRKAEVWTITPTSTVAVDGHGYGHGRGMSQYGSEGAARAGLTSAQIMDFYYPGTTTGSAGGQVKVAVLMQRAGLERGAAEARLAECGGFLRAALGERS